MDVLEMHLRVDAVPGQAVPQLAAEFKAHRMGWIVEAEPQFVIVLVMLVTGWSNRLEFDPCAKIHE